MSRAGNSPGEPGGRTSNPWREGPGWTGQLGGPDEISSTAATHEPRDLSSDLPPGGFIRFCFFPARLKLEELLPLGLGVINYTSDSGIFSSVVGMAFCISEGNTKAVRSSLEGFSW